MQVGIEQKDVINTKDKKSVILHSQETFKHKSNPLTPQVPREFDQSQLLEVLWRKLSQCYMTGHCIYCTGLPNTKVVLELIAAAATIHV